MRCDIPPVAVEDSKHFSIFIYIGGYDMDMLVLRIRMPDHYIRLFPIAHITHVLFGNFKESIVIKVFPVWKVQANVGIPVLGGIALSLKMEYVSEELL
jgi:hypothetical protein